MSIGPIYKFPVPKLANGTQATTATDPSASTIDNIREKYAAFFGTTGITGLYGSGLKEVLSVLSEILEDDENVKPNDFSATMEYLKGSSFYTNAQTFGEKRIDENCREGFLAYRYYLKTIAGIVSNIYGFLEAGRTALAALDGTTDSDKAHVLIIQLEIYEKFIYEAFQSLCTYYQYNADMKQWDQKINFDPNKLGSSTDKNFTTQLYTYSSYNTLSDLRATQIDCLDSTGISTTEGEPKTSKIQLNVFNSISLLDRLRYIYYYYKLIFGRSAALDSAFKRLINIQIKYRDKDEVYENLRGATVNLRTLQDILNIPNKTDVNKDWGKDLFNSVPVYIKNVPSEDLEDAEKLELENVCTILSKIDIDKLLNETRATDYSVFPEDANTGYPCRPDEKSTEATKDTRSLGALEMFYVGYLIDRDGPINAVASFFEVKVAALRNNLSLLSKKITALNTYLDFINRGMDVLNQSQSKKKSRIPDGAVLALTYLCGQKMYNLFEASNGNKYVVVPLVIGDDAGKYILLRADESGKKFFIGDDGSKGGGMGNGSCGIALKNDLFDFVMYNGGDDWKGRDHKECTTSANDTEPKGLYATDTIKKNESDKYPYYYGAIENIDGTFKLPTQLEVNPIIPGSVKCYTTAYNPKKEDDKGNSLDLDENEHTSMIESWTNAFSNKTQYINTAIDTINTDVTVDRSKIDTFDSLTSTFRSRAHDAYTNIASNIRG